jgi:hypothetical protein
LGHVPAQPATVSNWRLPTSYLRTHEEHLQGLAANWWIEHLRDYNKWVGKSPTEILNEVKQVPGGWASVFPHNLPLFAHQVRNFFNVEPTSLTLLPRDDSNKYLREVRKRFEAWGFVDTAKGILALSNDVYRDQSNRIWYQMSAGATIYHWGGEPTWDVVDATFSNFVRKQDGVPVFKLISPDGTGGSAETIIKNRRRFTIGAPNELVPVRERVVTDYHHQGSYNFSETVEAGLPAHEKHDVWPHKKWPREYLNPADRFSPLASRRFPARIGDRVVGYERGLEPYEFDSTRPDAFILRPQGKITYTDPLAELMAKRYPPNHPGSLERVKLLELMFHKTSRPKKLLARIEARRDKAAQDFYAILDPKTVLRLIQILRGRPQGGPRDVGSR